jgi:hypothetical protein
MEEEQENVSNASQEAQVPQAQAADVVERYRELVASAPDLVPELETLKPEAKIALGLRGR